jgi:penicillin-binding protein 2
VRGVLPNQEWKRNTYKRPEQKKWFAGETISLGIGQGYNNFTILQLANAMAMLANHGVKNKPQLGLGRVDAVTANTSLCRAMPPSPWVTRPAMWRRCAARWPR